MLEAVAAAAAPLPLLPLLPLLSLHPVLPSLNACMLDFWCVRGLKPALKQLFSQPYVLQVPLTGELGSQRE